MPLTFSQPILNGSNRLNMASPPLHRRPPRPSRIDIRTLDIPDGKGFRLVQAIRAVEPRGVDVVLMTDKKIQTEANSHNQIGYEVTFSAACPSSAGGAQVGVGLLTRERPNGWGIESMRFHGPNVVSCKIVTEHTHTPIVCAYLPPSTLEHLP